LCLRGTAKHLTTTNKPITHAYLRWVLVSFALVV
jgi:hypothetical protein